MKKERKNLNLVDEKFDYQRELRYPNIKIVKNLLKEKRPRRNQKCPCGSGDKYKWCCLIKAKQAQIDSVLVRNEKENQKEKH